MPRLTVEAEPAALSVDTANAALLIIDMQRDFLEPGGFGAALGNDVSRLQAVVSPRRNLLAAARNVGMLIIHTREGHRPISRTRHRSRSSAASVRTASARAGAHRVTGGSSRYARGVAA